MTEETRPAEYEETVQKWEKIILDCADPTDVKYDNNAEEYDKDMEIVGWKGPALAADVFEKHFPNQNDVRVLDVAAGSGLAAEHLRKKGYTNLDALDCSQGMLNKAKEKGLYHKYICTMFGSERVPGIKTDDYDAITCVGAIGCHHLPADCLFEMIRIVKPGGIILNLYFDNLERDDLEALPVLQEKLVKAGALQVLSDERIPNVYPKETGILTVYRVKASEVKPDQL